MQISSSDLLNLPVETQSGQHLGRISSFDVDLETNSITHYHVKTGLIKDLWHQELLIHRNQVISISREKMVVKDGVSPEPAAGLKKVKLAATPK